MIPLVGDEYLDFQRDAVETNFPDTCAITTTTYASDGRGGSTATTSTTSGVPCHLTPSGQTPAERIIAEQVAPAAVWTLLLPHGTSVPDSASVAVTLASGTVKTLQVVKALEHTYESALKVVVRE